MIEDDESAAFEFDLLQFGDLANTGPAFGLHLVEVFHASKIGNAIRSS